MAEPSSCPPFWSLFGGKYNLSRSHYPPPLHDRIVEPFAGAASYSVCYPERDVVLIDKDERFVKIWKYLIKATPEKYTLLGKVDLGLEPYISASFADGKVFLRRRNHVISCDLRK